VTSTQSQTSQSRFRLAVDIGGTFTDVAAFDETDGTLLLGKSLSTPQAMVAGIEEAVQRAGMSFAETSLLLHGSTIAINTILERTGANTALIITEGFRDIYEIGRINRPDSYNLFFKKHQPLVPRERCLEVTERVYADGEVCKPLDEAEIRALARHMAQQGIEAVAILFLHCYRNAQHEIRAKDILERELPDVFVTASHELTQEYREFERCSTVVANAFIGPRVRRYLSQIKARIDAAGFKGSFLVVQSTGGLFEIDKAQRECIRILESGPAAGVIGTQAICRVSQIKDAIAFDMGGTTAKAGVVLDGRVITAGSALIGGYDRALPIQIPTIDIFEVGTGGGSIARVEHGGALHVGPQSAGSEPGPASYGRGGAEPTITDANLLLGRLGAQRFLGGELILDVEAAKNAIQNKVAGPLRLPLADAAEGILRIAVAKMANAVKGVTTERGLDAAAFSLVAYGGAGPLHACALAREIGIRTVVIPNAPGHFSAFGMLFSDLRHDFVRTWFTRLDSLPFEAFEQAYRTLEQEGRDLVDASAVAPLAVTIARALDMRYVGQEHVVTVDVPIECFQDQDRTTIKKLFDSVHLERYGTSAPSEPAEIASLRTCVTGIVPKPSLAHISRGCATPPDSANTGSRSAYFAAYRRFVDTPTYDRSRLLAGNRIEGPALVEEYASTTVVLPGDVLEVDDWGHLVVEIGVHRL